MLWVLTGLPLLGLLYGLALRRSKRIHLRYPGLSLVQDARVRGPSWRRHLPPLLLGLAIAIMLVAAARPVAVISLPSAQQTIILAMDVSGSMRATDVKPNRLVASQEAAKAFVNGLPREVRVGIVAFAGSAQVAQLPTRTREDLVRAIDAFQLQRGTATGNSIMLSLATIFPEAGIELSTLPGARPTGRALEPNRSGPPPEFQPVAPGSYNSAVIIMLTDGQRTTGVDPLDAARVAAQRGVKVYTVGVGTVDGETIGFEGWSMRVRLDEDTLKEVAKITAGEYFYAGTAGDLQKVYETLGTRLTVEKAETELSALLALLAALITLCAAGLSLFWSNRIV
jgi:Ca-activated chloride channel family protein